MAKRLPLSQVLYVAITFSELRKKCRGRGREKSKKKKKKRKNVTCNGSIS